MRPVAGAFVGAAVLSVATAELSTIIWGNFEGAAAMGGAEIGAGAGLILGFALSLWAVLRHGGHHAGTALAGIGIATLIVLAAAAYLIVS